MKNAKQVLTFFFTLSFACVVQALESDITPEIRAVEKNSELKPHVGLGVGVGNPSGELNTGGNYSVEVGFQPIIPFSLIGEYSVDTYDHSGPGKLVRNRLLIKADYNFGGSVPFVRYSYVGLGAGPMWEDTEVDNEFAFAVMPHAGFDYPLKKVIDRSPLTLGANVSQLYSTSDNPDVFAIKGVVKYWY